MGANKRNLSDEQRVIADELDKIQIDQLHKATLNFSNNSLETKKLCVTVSWPSEERLSPVEAQLSGLSGPC